MVGYVGIEIFGFNGYGLVVICGIDNHHVFLRLGRCSLIYCDFARYAGFVVGYRYGRLAGFGCHVGGSRDGYGICTRFDMLGRKCYPILVARECAVVWGVHDNALFAAVIREIDGIVRNAERVGFGLLGAAAQDDRIR